MHKFVQDFSVTPQGELFSHKDGGCISEPTLRTTEMGVDSV